MEYGENIHFIEPDLNTKRRGMVKARLGKVSERTEQEIKDKLLDLRKQSIADTQNNLRTFKKNAKQKGFYDIHIAKTPAEVVKYISKQNKRYGLSRIDMNRSNTLRTLIPELNSSGFETIQTYNYAVSSGSVGIYDTTEPGQYWTLDKLELESKFQAFNYNPSPIAYSKELIHKATSDQPFIGLVGANVFSASGEILEIQHLYNISSILTHATQSFIVLTLDKLVDNYQNALYQARCTAMFGLDQILLDLFDIERFKDTVGDDKGIKRALKGSKKIEHQPKRWKTKDAHFDSYRSPENLHIIILDDDRNKFIGTKQEELLYCIGCRRCGLYCPRVRVGKQRPTSITDLTQISFTLTARELIMDGHLFGLERAVDEGLFDCTLCRSCTNVCPVGIDLAEYILELRESCQDMDIFAKPHKRIRKNILETGNAYGSDYVGSTVSPTKSKSGGRR